MVDRYWQDEPGPPRRGARLLLPTAAVLMRAAWSVRVHQREHIPTDGPVILASNHTGFLDGPLLYSVAPRPVHALVKQEFFHGPVGRALTALGQIPIDRVRVDPRAVKRSLAVLDAGDVLAIYPEGTRGTGDFTRFKAGVAYLGLCTGAPIVPVACLGIREAGRSTGSLPRIRSRLEVVFGAPIAIDPVPWPRRRDVVRSVAADLQERLAAHVRYAVELTGRALP